MLGSCLQLQNHNKMLRNFSSKLILGFKPRKCLNLRLISSDEKYFEDSKLPRFSKEGLPLRDPRDILDPDYEKPVGNVTSENFQFDVKQGIGQVSVIFLIKRLKKSHYIIITEFRRGRRPFQRLCF